MSADRKWARATLARVESKSVGSTMSARQKVTWYLDGYNADGEYLGRAFGRRLRRECLANAELLGIEVDR